jgi:hypothetical protein
LGVLVRDLEALGIAEPGSPKVTDQWLYSMVIDRWLYSIVIIFSTGQ